MSSKSTIPDRFDALLQIWVDGINNVRQDKFAWLEDRSNVKAGSWKAVWHRKQKPTTDMLEAICKSHPEFAFWLMTGVEDSRFGHKAPLANGYPELTRDLIASSNYLQNELLVSTQADFFIEETYPDLEFEAKNEIEKLALYDKLKRYVSFSEYEIDNRKQMKISVSAGETHDENFRIRFMEILLENIMVLRNMPLEFKIIEQIIFDLTRNTKASNYKFDVLEKAHKMRDFRLQIKKYSDEIHGEDVDEEA